MPRSLSIPLLLLLGSTACTAPSDTSEAEVASQAALRGKAESLVGTTWSRKGCEKRASGVWKRSPSCSTLFSYIYFTYPSGDNEADTSGDALILTHSDPSSDQPGTRYYCNVSWRSATDGSLTCEVYRSMSNEEGSKLTFVFKVAERSLTLTTSTERWTYGPG